MTRFSAIFNRKNRSDHVPNISLSNSGKHITQFQRNEQESLPLSKLLVALGSTCFVRSSCGSADFAREMKSESFFSCWVPGARRFERNHYFSFVFFFLEAAVEIILGFYDLRQHLLSFFFENRHFLTFIVWQNFLCFFHEEGICFSSFIFLIKFCFLLRIFYICYHRARKTSHQWRHATSRTSVLFMLALLPPALSSVLLHKPLLRLTDCVKRSEIPPCYVASRYDWSLTPSAWLDQIHFPIVVQFLTRE